MRRAFLLLAFASCARQLPDAGTGASSPEPLVVGHSPVSATTGEPTDAGPVVATWMTGPRDAAVSTGCYVDAKGKNGGLTTAYACFVEQEPDRHVSDSGRPFLGIWPTTLDPDLRIVILRDAVPHVGVQPSSSFTAIARIGVWAAETSSLSGSTMGTFTLTLTSVRAVRDSGLGAYELHGMVDAQLIPNWNSSAVGYIDLHADF